MNKKIINLRSCVVTVKDGSSPSAKTLVASDIEGTLEITLAGYEPVHILNKGAYQRTNQGAFQPGSFTFSENFALFAQNSASSPVSLVEALTKTGGASAWTTVNSQSDYFQVQIEITLPLQIGETSQEVLVLKNAGVEQNVSVTLDYASKVALKGFHSSTAGDISTYTP